MIHLRFLFTRKMAVITVNTSNVIPVNTLTVLGADTIGGTTKNTTISIIPVIAMLLKIIYDNPIFGKTVLNTRYPSI